MTNRGSGAPDAPSPFAPTGTFKVTVGDQWVDVLRAMTIKIESEMGAAIRIEYPGGAIPSPLFNRFLLRHNIVAWGGPGFDGVPVTPENIDRLSPGSPIVSAVIEALVNRGN